MNDCVFKYFSDPCKIYICIKYFATWVYILRIVKNCIDTIMAIECHYDANEILKCFVQRV